MQKLQLMKVKQVVGASFRNKRLLNAALTHPSYRCHDGQVSSPELFQRLEFLGDAVLNLFIANKLYHLFPGANEGLLSRMRSILVSRKLLARVSRTIRLQSILLMGHRERHQPATVREKILADAFEALVAALYLDRGLKPAEQFLSKCFRPHFDHKKLFQFDPNPKSLLQEYVQKKHARLPIYHSIRRGDQFEAWVAMKRTQKGKGKGRTKQEAEAQAATALLKKLKIKRKAPLLAPALAFSRKETALKY